jgi:hypothetical protein
MFDRQKIIEYIEDKHLPDGGYFFAKVEPSGGLDTYLAVRILKLLGIRPQKEESILTFWQKEEQEGNLDNITGLFLWFGTLKELDYRLELSESHRQLLTRHLQGKELLKKRTFQFTEKGKFGLYDTSPNTLYTDILEGELKELFYLTTLLCDLKLDFNKQTIIDFVLSLQNNDGGFGQIRDSQISTTYYALKILTLLSYPLKYLSNTAIYTKKEWLKVNYLEELYWVIESLVLLGQPLPSPEQVTLFLYDCRRDNGGFSRSRNMGISTIEYTYYAVSILVAYEHYFNKKIIN